MKSTLLCVVPLLLISMSFYCCSSGTPKTETNSSKTDTNLNAMTYKSSSLDAKGQIKIDSAAEFEKRIYFQIDKIYTGKVYTIDNNSSAFYRILIIPEEENIMIIAENILVLDEEGSNLKLRKLSRLTDDNSVLPKFGLSSADSIKFIDSVTIEGYFNNKKETLNLDKLRPYHPIFR